MLCLRASLLNFDQFLCVWCERDISVDGWKIFKLITTELFVSQLQLYEISCDLLSPETSTLPVVVVVVVPHLWPDHYSQLSQ